MALFLKNKKLNTDTTADMPCERQLAILLNFRPRSSRSARFSLIFTHRAIHTFFLKYVYANKIAPNAQYFIEIRPISSRFTNNNEANFVDLFARSSFKTI